MIQNLPNLGGTQRERIQSTEKNPSIKEQGRSNEKQSPEFSQLLEKNAEKRAEKKGTHEQPARSAPGLAPSKNERFVGQKDKVPAKLEASEPEVPKDAISQVVAEEIPQESEAQEVAARQMAILKFMDSLESELGVPPERIVEAMATLTPEDLLQPPEDTALQVVENLDLEEGEKTQALALYAGLLQSLANLPKAQVAEEANAYAAGGVGAGAAASVGLSQAQMPINQKVDPATLTVKERKLMMNQSIDQMAKKFFMKDGAGNASPLMEAPAAGEVLSEGGADLSILQKMPSVDSIQMKNLTPTQANVSPLNMKEQPFFLDRDTLQKIEMQKLGSMAPDNALQGYRDIQDIPNLEVSVEAAPVLMAPTGLVAGIAAGGAEGSGTSSGWSGGDRGSANEQDKSGNPELEVSAADVGQQSNFFPEQRVKEGSTFATALAANELRGTGEASGNQALDKLVGQAKLVTAEGGGEAIVNMNPEGLGEVRLKIAVRDGRVQVDLAAETPEAKKVIENSIGDLKNALSSQKLTVDSVKVDVGTQLGNEKQSSNQESQFDFRQDQGREQARQFMGQFREENMARREPFTESSAIRNYQKPSRILPPANENSSAASSTRRYSGEGRGARMNIVA